MTEKKKHNKSLYIAYYDKKQKLERIALVREMALKDDKTMLMNIENLTIGFTEKGSLTFRCSKKAQKEMTEMLDKFDNSEDEVLLMNTDDKEVIGLSQKEFTELMKGYVESSLALERTHKRKPFYIS